MARTINEIADSLKVALVRNNNLRGKYGFTGYTDTDDDATVLTYYNSKISTVSVTTCLLFIFAACTAALEKMFDWFREDVTTRIDHERYGYAGWYEKMALKFRFGVDLNINYLAEPDAAAIDGDFAENDLYPEITDADELAALQVVKYAYCSENENGHVGVVLKIAGIDSSNALCPLSTTECGVFEEYINRIKPAGIPITIINDNNDELSVELAIMYNPLVMNSDGTLINDGSEPVKDAILNYFNSIEFNGEFVKMKLVDAIQAVEGVDIVELISATHRRGGIDTNIEIRCQPYSGYFKLDMDNDCIIEYTANV